jgi:predicted RNA-binding Zn-ribbon protein involved in translation (DUF1610 family)
MKIIPGTLWVNFKCPECLTDNYERLVMADLNTVCTHCGKDVELDIENYDKTFE